MKIKFIITSFLFFVTLAGCETLQDMKANYELGLMDSAKKACAEFGFKESTDSFANCVQKEINEEKNRDALQDAARKANDS